MEWYTPYIEAFIEEMEAVGISIAQDQVQFTGFWSQGDGASFEFDASDCDHRKFCSELVKRGFLLTPEFKARLEMYELLPDDHEVERFLKLCDLLIISSARTDSRYSHENTCNIEVDVDYDLEVADEKQTEDFANLVEAAAEKWRLQESKRLYRMLEEGWEESGDEDSEEY